MANFLKNYFLIIIMVLGSVFVITFALLKAPLSAVKTSDQSVTTAQNISESASPVKIPPPIVGKIVEDYNQPQSLPRENVTIRKLDGASIIIDAEMATKPREEAIGMMFRNTVPEKTGMLFLFEDIEKHDFWMKNTFVSLDIIFIDAQKKISKIHRNAVPQKLDAISSDGEVASVLEIGAGQSDALGLSVGDTVENALLDTFVTKALENKEQEKNEHFEEE